LHFINDSNSLCIALHNALYNTLALQVGSMMFNLWKRSAESLRRAVHHDGAKKENAVDLTLQQGHEAHLANGLFLFFAMCCFLRFFLTHLLLSCLACNDKY
jgi:hypothetical protein